MSLFDTHLLSLLTFLPLFFAGLLAFLPAGEGGQIRGLTMLALLLDLVLGVMAWMKFDPTGPEFQLLFRSRWVDAIGLSYHVGVDGLAVSLLLLTVALGPIAVLASWTFVQTRVKEFHIALLVLQTAMLGAVISLDVLLFYIFFEAMLVPMYLLIGVWGSENRQMAAMKFFVYTLVGSLLMLVALIAVYLIAQPAGMRSFDYATIYNGLLAANQELAACRLDAAACANLSPMAASLSTYGPWLFAAFALAFAIKVPMFPVHTWLPDAHVQAPVAGSIVLAGVMLKMGTFGFWRYAVPLFPDAASGLRTVLAALAMIGIIYGALMCLAQRDVKKLIAYSSVSHMGYCMLGIFAFTGEGATGSAYQMLAHGVATGALFLLFGYLYERRHTRLISDYGGIARVMPAFTAFFVLTTFTSVALPGTVGFVGEFLVLMGTFRSNLPLWIGVIATSAVILGAAYMLWMVQKVFFGPLTHQENHGLKDLNGRELLSMVPLAILMLVMGLMPQPFLSKLEPSVDRFVARANLSVADTPRVPDSVLRIQAAPLPPLEAVADADEPQGAPLAHVAR